MGPIGAQEMFLIFMVALLLFGPKKLPELGRTVGKALTQFRRVSSDMKASFEREMQNLEREAEAEKLREFGTTTIQQIQDKANEIIEYPYYDSGSYEPDPYPDYVAAITPSVDASEVPSVESSEAAGAPPPAEAPPVEATSDSAPNAVEGTVPRESPQHTN